LDSGASRHMMKARELFNRLSEEDSKIHVELGNDAKYAMRVQGTVQFQLESGGSFDAQEVLYVPGLKKNLFPSQSWRTKVMQLPSIGDMCSSA
jgi:hypothetical protein